MDELFADAGNRMEKAVEAVRREFAKIRTGKATVALLGEAAHVGQRHL